MKTKIWQIAALSSAIILLGFGAAYAYFTSNTVSLNGNRLTTGQATLKLCETTASNSWTNGLEPSTNLSDMIPNEERDVLANRSVVIGNDNGNLISSLPGNECTSYTEPAAHSVTPMRILPNVSFTNEGCPDPLQSNVKLRFEINALDTGYKTLNSWATNTTAVDSIFAPGDVHSVKAYAQLSSTTTQQQGNCLFTITFTGKQPTT